MEIVKHTLRLAPGVALLLVLAAGCGSTHTAAPAASNKVPGVSSASAPSGGASAPDATQSSPGDDSSAPDAAESSSSDAADDSGDDSFCTIVAEKDASDLLSVSGTADGGDSDTNAASLATIDQMAAAAPAAIKSDVVQFDQLAHGLLKDVPDASALQQAASQDEVARVQRIRDYVTQHCGDQ